MRLTSPDQTSKNCELYEDLQTRPSGRLPMLGIRRRRGRRCPGHRRAPRDRRRCGRARHLGGPDRTRNDGRPPGRRGVHRYARGLRHRGPPPGPLRDLLRPPRRGASILRSRGPRGVRNGLHHVEAHPFGPGQRAHRRIPDPRPRISVVGDDDRRRPDEAPAFGRFGLVPHRESGHVGDDRPDRRRRHAVGPSGALQRPRRDVLDPERVPAQRHERYRSVRRRAPLLYPRRLQPPDGPAGKRRPSCGGPFPGRDARPRHEGRRERVRGLVLGVRRGRAPRELEHNARP